MIWKELKTAKKVYKERPFFINIPAKEVYGEEVEEDRAEKLAKILREQILELKKKRTRQSKLKITDAEKQYKERAVKGLLYDLIDEMNQRRG